MYTPCVYNLINVNPAWKTSVLRNGRIESINDKTKMSYYRKIQSANYLKEYHAKFYMGSNFNKGLEII